ncbi:universal stress protein [Aureibaculum sp. 2210JD6-5]|uniref:universal stress protein n=1 Tax=Aureibaculum sp. 2210JD6-5 TaxID=3103957 RepID=UPI002AAE4E6D|nr:universal stress protein [Aureibaculum sp. 2210JD6-5]MDY7396876.1 universal stress protein [Aureibaculum sp. 2210JD6-5]
MKKILIAIDDSSSALNAAIFGIEFAINYDLEVGIVEVTNLSIGNIDAGIIPQDIEKANQFKAKINIEQVKSLFPKVNIKEFEPIGKPVEEIKKIIELYNGDMLIIGHQTHNLWHKLFANNVESELASHVKIPLLIIPGKERK